MSFDEEVMTKAEKTKRTKGLLRWAALFLGELRDGLTMVRVDRNDDRLNCIAVDLTVVASLSDQHAKRFFDCCKGESSFTCWCGRLRHRQLK